MADLVTSILIKAKDLTQSAINAVKSGLSGLDKETKKAGTSTDKLGTESAQTAAQQDRQRTSTDQLKNSTKQYQGVLGATTAKLIAFGGAYLGLSKLKDGLLSILNVGGKFETLQIQLQSVIGTVAGGEAAFAWIKDFAKNTPLQLDGVTNAFVKLKAFGLDPMDGTMQKLTDISSKMGGGQERLEGIILAVGQAWSKGKLQAEEANQLIERGIPVWDLMAKAVGKTSAEVQEMASNGELTRKEIKLLIDAMGDSAIGASAAQMKTWNGVVSNAKDTIITFLNTIAESGALDFFKQQLQSLLNVTNRMAADGSLKRWAKDISDGITGIANGIKNTIGFISEYATQLKSLAVAFAGIKLGAFIASITSSTAAIITSTTATGLASKAALFFNAALKANPIGAVVAALGFLIVNLKGVYDAYGLLNDQLEKNQQIEKEASNNKVERLSILEKEAKQLDINAKAYAGNTTALVDAIVERKIELGLIKDSTEASVDQAKAITQNSDEIRKSATDFIVSEQSKADATEKTGKVVEEVSKKIVAANEEAAKSVDKVAEATGILKIELAELKGEATVAGKEATKAFLDIAEGAGLTSEQIAKVADKTLQFAKTKGDLDLMLKAFDDIGVSASKHPEIVTEITEKIIEMGGSLDDIPSKWREIAKEAQGATKEIEGAQKASEDLSDSISANTNQNAPSSISSDNPKVLDQFGTEEGSRNDLVSQQFELDRISKDLSRSASKFQAFSEQGQQDFGQLNESGLAELQRLINDNQFKLARQLGASSTEQLTELALLRQNAEQAALEQARLLSEINGGIKESSVVVKLDGREIATSITRAGLTSRR